MKKTKLLAVLSAAMLGCCAMGGTAFAEEAEPVDYSKYQMGDINLDGVVDIEDAQLVQKYYTVTLAKWPLDTTLAFLNITEEQLVLGDIVREQYYVVDTVYVVVAQLILCYYTDKLCDKAKGKTLPEYVQNLIDTGWISDRIIVNNWR